MKGKLASERADQAKKLHVAQVGGGRGWGARIATQVVRGRAGFSFQHTPCDSGALQYALVYRYSWHRWGICGGLGLISILSGGGGFKRCMCDSRALHQHSGNLDVHTLLQVLQVG